MNKILSELEYENYIIDILHQQNNYVVRPNKAFDPKTAIDREMLFAFLKETQNETLEALYNVYHENTQDTIVNFINAEITKPEEDLISVLKKGIDIAHSYHLDLMYRKPATTYNEEAVEQYDANILSVMKEVWANEEERVDLVIFLNGIAIISFELKCNYANQYYGDAIDQYKTTRTGKERLFLFKAGCFVNFAMDLKEVYMCTQLCGKGSTFLPFNLGCGEGIDKGKGNPECANDYPVHYMWDDILKKDTIIDLISSYIFVERKEKTDEVTGKKKLTETLIFPRYHQLDAVRQLTADAIRNHTSQNYLIQHSAGSGKTNTIAWLAYKLSSLHDADNKMIYDTTIICTDRVVVDKQLQDAVLGLEHKDGLIKVMNDKCTSADLADTLLGYTVRNGIKINIGSAKIVATTIQKFPYIVDAVKSLNKKNFAVIIDEAHSSTSGKEMTAITSALGSDEGWDIDDVQEKIIKELAKIGKQPNVSMFAFTATPKPETLKLFGKVQPNGQIEAFHLYSMKQAIEEKYILDVLENYVDYKTFYRLNKEITDDPKYKTREAKRQIARFVDLNDVNISQRVEIIVEHFRTTIASELGGKAKAMVITASRQAAVKYRQALEDYVTRKGYTDIHALVAFTGSVPDGEKVYTESSMNGFHSDLTTEKFDTDAYNVLLVANKYQTGFDQKKLCAMYIIKRLRGVNAVQTLSRLNRTCYPYDKKTFILDFVNTYEDMEKAFSHYYTRTILSNSTSPSAVYDIEAKLDSYFVFDPYDISVAIGIIYNKEITSADKKELTFILQRAEKKLKENDLDKQREIVGTIRSFIRCYEFLIQATCFEDVDLHKKYLFMTYFLPFISISEPGQGFDLSDKIRADNFVQKKGEEHTKTILKPDPIVKLPVADDYRITENATKHLSEIIEEINVRTGIIRNTDATVRSLLQICDLLASSEELKTSAKANTETDFAFPYYDSVDDALLAGLTQNQEFYTHLLNNEDEKREVFGIFLSMLYKKLRNEE